MWLSGVREDPAAVSFLDGASIYDCWVSTRPPMPVAVGLITAGMLALALVVNAVANRFGWFQAKTNVDRLDVLSVTPAVEPIDGTDFIELDQVGVKMMPTYIKMHGDGRVERDAVSRELVRFGGWRGAR